MTTPHAATWADSLTAAGSIAAWQEASIGAQVGSLRLVDVVGDIRRASLILTLTPRGERPAQTVVETEVRARLAHVAGARFTLSGAGRAGSSNWSSPATTSAP